jgi:hypothetical protein
MYGALLLFFVAFIPSALCGIAQVSNKHPRVDAETGKILNIHDGTTIRVGDTFFWYGSGYGECHEQPTGCSNITAGQCGFQLNHTVNLATSKDFVSWKFYGAVLLPSNRPPGILFGPWVAVSKTTKRYVLWTNILPVDQDGTGNFKKSFYSIAESASPFGPFVTVVPNVANVAYEELPDSPSVFVDDDGTGYVAFTHETNHINTVQQLTPDLKTPIPGAVSDVIGPPDREGPPLQTRPYLLRHDWYAVLLLQRRVDAFCLYIAAPLGAVY